MSQPPLIGLLGGTFDPVHIGHLEIAKILLKKIDFLEIQFIPCHIPPHRENPNTSSYHRLNMVKLTIENEKKLAINDIELKKDTPSYTIDTLKSLHQENPDATLCFIIGSDAFSAMQTWKEWESILNYCHIIIVKRVGFPLILEPELDAAYKQNLTHHLEGLTQHPSGKIYYSDITLPDINATNIREALKSENKEYYLSVLPKSVLQYIQKNKLYNL
jgi:nicotinate-nucleotide adenylyltransferase